MKFGKLLSLVLALLLILSAHAESDIEAFIADYNYYAAENQAEQISRKNALFDEDGWVITLSDGSQLGLAFDADGYVDLIMVQCSHSSTIGATAFINSLYVADASLEKDELTDTVLLIIVSREDTTLLFHGWYLAYEYDSAENCDYIGVIWVGEDENAPTDAPEASVTPSPTQSAPDTYKGKPVNKA